MSYWFERPHALVLARARIDLRDPRKRDRLRAKSETAFAERALASCFWPQELKCCSGFTLISGQADQNSRRARSRAIEASFAGSAGMPLQRSVEASDQS